VEFGFDEDNTVEEFLDYCIFALVIRIGDRLHPELSYLGIISFAFNYDGRAAITKHSSTVRS